MGDRGGAAASHPAIHRRPRPYRPGQTTSGRVSEAVWARIQAAVEAEDSPALAGVLVRDSRMACVGAVSEALANTFATRPDFSWATLEAFSRDPRRILRCCYGFGLLGERFVPFGWVWPHLERLLDEELEPTSWTVRECHARGLLWLMWSRYDPSLAAEAVTEAGRRDGAGGDAPPPLFHRHDPLHKALAAWRDGPSVNLRRAAVMGMFFAQRLTHFVPQALDFVEPLLHDDSHYVRRNLGPFLLSVLGSKPGEAGQAVIDSLRAWARVEDQNVRWNVASAWRAQLGTRRPAEGLEVLQVLAADARLGVRRAVASALVHMGRRHPRLVLGVLEGWVRDPLRRAVAEAALARLGPAGKGRGAPGAV